MLTVVTWLWEQPGYRTRFTAEHVNTLARMIGRYYALPHRVICVTKLPGGLDPAIEVLDDPALFSEVPSPHGPAMPSCYRRLLLFHPRAEVLFGERYVSLDLDCAVVGDLVPLWNRPEDFVGWRDPYHRKQYNGSMALVRAGSSSRVWSDFRPVSSPRLALMAGYVGSDQGWISYKLWPGATWDERDGVLSYRRDAVRELPADARIVFFHGKVKPWDAPARDVPWIADAYSLNSAPVSSSTNRRPVLAADE